MKIAIGLAVLIVFVYTAGFAISLWKDKNKMGSFMVFLLAIGIVVASFFSAF